jgi:hypothetical protein
MSPSTFCGLPARSRWSTSMIANFVSGNCFATFEIAVAWSKPTEMTRSALRRAAVERFGIYACDEADW